MPDRRLAAVMVTDMVGFTILMRADQAHAIDTLDRCHELLKKSVARHQGEWLEDAGDRSLSAFPSAINAVQCACEIQEKLKEDPELQLRIGVDAGDIILTSGHVYGDTVNIVSSIERLADPGGLVITQSVYDAIHGQIDLNVIDLGAKILKNVDYAVRLYALTGRKQRSPMTNFLSSIMARRVPHITGAYLAASWAAVEVTDWLASQGAFSPVWVYGVLVGLIAATPSVALVTYLHGTHGHERLTRTEKFAVPLNLVIAMMIVGYVWINAEQLPETLADLDPGSIAVLPFVNLSDEEIDSYVSYGLSEELINALAKVPGLQVASRTSSFVFNGHDVDPRDIAQKLRVATILEGSVRKVGNNVRITAQLIDGKNNFHLWSETYNRQLSDIFQVQEDISAAVATELVGVLKLDVRQAFSKARAETIDAYDFYLRGLEYLRRPPTDDSLSSARSLFGRALDYDPDYAQAHAALCEVSLQAYLIHQAPSHIDVAELNCLKALALDEDARDVKYALGELYRATGDFDQSEESFRELLQRRPTPRALVGFAQTMLAKGEFAAAEASYSRAIDRELSNWQHSLAYAKFLSLRGRHEEALSYIDDVIKLSPDNANAYGRKGACLEHLGNVDGAVEALQKSIDMEPTSSGYRDLGLTYYHVNEIELAAEAYEHAVELGPENHYSWSSLASAYRFLDGMQDESRAAYERAITLAEAVLERNSKDWATLSRLAVNNVMIGDIETGVSRIETAVAEGLHVGDVHLHHAYIRSHLGQEDQALDALERGLDVGLSVRLVANDPYFDSLHDNARFQELIIY